MHRSKTSRNGTRRRRTRASRPVLTHEALEPRVMLDGDGFLAANDVYLSLSFVEDGTTAVGQASTLAATFDAIAPRAAWEDAILRAFQTWAVETNADIGVVADSGEPFGTPGRSQRDSRFGDVRIGAIEMSPEVGAVSVPVDGVVTGTWYGDVLFNTSFDYQSLDDIFAVALHEAGNVFGLDDNADPNSPLFSGGAATGLPPTGADLAALAELHGTRSPDLNELPDDGEQNANDTIADATRLKLVEFGEGEEGSAPSIVYGDVTTAVDRDFYELKGSDDYTGPATIQIRSAGISLLAPQVTIYDKSGLAIWTHQSTSTRGDALDYQIASLSPDDAYYVEVAGDGDPLGGIGGYSVTALFNNVNLVDQATIDSLAGGQFRYLDQDDFEEFFDVDDDDLFAIDLNSNDTAATATTLKTASGFIENTRYNVVASIDNSSDVDFYRLRAPNSEPTPADTMTVAVRSLDTGGLIPRIEVFDDSGQPTTARLLASGGGTAILQVDGVAAEDELMVSVAAADASGPFHLGNYELTVTFDDVATVLDLMASGTVGALTTQNTHTLYIGQPQLFHLALAVDAAATSSPTVVVATVRDAAGSEIYQVATRPGDLQSRPAVFLQPGAYSVEIVPWTLDGSEPPALSYELLGASISDPFVGDPDDPTAHPFACTEPGMEGLFCYPGGFISPDPFLWDDFIDSLTTPVEEVDLPTLVGNLIGDWWSWVWDSISVNGPPLAQGDTTQVPVGDSSAAASTFVGPTGSLLDNDVDPEGAAVVAIKKTDPEHGTLELEPDGTFVYTPEAGFTGRDAFTYVAYDFVSESAEATVAIVVGISGDFDADGNVSGFDFLKWQRGAGTLGGAVLTDGDSNFDGNVNGADLDVWVQQFVTPTPQAQVSPDPDGDGDVDGADLLAWQRGVGISAGADAADGDYNGDARVDGDDVQLMEASFGHPTPAAVGNAALATSLSAAPQQSVPANSFLTAPDSVAAATPVEAAARYEPGSNTPFLAVERSSDAATPVRQIPSLRPAASRPVHAAASPDAAPRDIAFHDFGFNDRLLKTTEWMDELARSRLRR